MQEPITSDHEKLSKLAGYLAHGFMPSQAGAAVGFSAGRVSQLLNQEDFKQLVADKTAELTEQYANVNRALDTLEARSLGNLVQQLSYNQDPDLNLRVAIFANKAVRRGQQNPIGQPIVPVKNGDVVNINLNLNFVQKMQNGGSIEMRDAQGQVESVHNSATPDIVNQLLVATGMPKLERDRPVSMAEAGFIDMTPVD